MAFWSASASVRTGWLVTISPRLNAWLMSCNRFFSLASVTRSVQLFFFSMSLLALRSQPRTVTLETCRDALSVGLNEVSVLPHTSL